MKDFTRNEWISIINDEIKNIKKDDNMIIQLLTISLIITSLIVSFAISDNLIQFVNIYVKIGYIIACLGILMSIKYRLDDRKREKFINLRQKIINEIYYFNIKKEYNNIQIISKELEKDVFKMLIMIIILLILLYDDIINNYPSLLNSFQKLILYL